MSGSDVLDDSLSELGDLPGLAGVKREIKQVLAGHRAVEQEAAGSKVQNPHLLLIGRSGVGKGTVAHALGEIFRNRGLLRSGHLVFADRSSLVAAYSGQTATKTLAQCKEALDGVLYIDDAHRLKGDFGREAADALLGIMQIHGDRIVVVMDSWPREIAEFRTAYPQLLNQFRPIEFPLYSADELMEILRAMAGRVRYALPDELDLMIRPWLEQQRDRAIERGAFWRSAWVVRDLLIHAAGNQATRTGTKNHFDYPGAAAYVRQPVTECEIAGLELADFQAAIADGADG